MDRFHVEVYVPLLETNYEVFLPVNSRIYYVIKTFVNYLDNISDEFVFSDMDCCLSNRINGVVYDNNMTVFGAGIRNGSKLMLM